MKFCNFPLVVSGEFIGFGLFIEILKFTVKFTTFFFVGFFFGLIDHVCVCVCVSRVCACVRMAYRIMGSMCTSGFLILTIETKRTLVSVVEE